MTSWTTPRRRLTPIGLALLLGATFAGSAASSAEPDAAHLLRDALGRLPLGTALPSDALQAVFVDFAALPDAAWQGDALSRSGGARLGMAIGVEPLRRAALAGRAGLGLSLREIATVAAVGDGTGRPRAAVWRPRDPVGLDALEAHLRGRGFAARPDGSLAMENEVPLPARMRDPWLAVAPDGRALARRDAEAVVSAANAEALAAIAPAPGPQGSSDPTTSTVLAGLEARLDGTRPVQAVVFGPALTLRAGDPAALLNPDPAAAREAVRRDAAAAGTGLPPYARGIMADLPVDAERAAWVASLAYPDCATAEAAIERVRAAWPGWAPEDADGPAGRAVPVEGACAATFRAVAPLREGRNTVLDRIWGAVMRREPTPLDIR